MHIICLTPVEPGVYNDHESAHIAAPPAGWAVIPENVSLPSTFPRLGSIEVEEVDGVLTVTAMTEGTLPEPAPEPEPPKSEASVWDELDAAYQEGVNGAYDQ